MSEENVMPTCNKTQPKGWKCTREAGHDGPCALVKVSKWKQFVDSVGNALGEAMFGGDR